MEKSRTGGDVIGKQRVLLGLTIVAALLLAASIIYGMTSDSSPYTHHTGMGASISISPDDETIAFSYYLNGDESIYMGNMEDESVERLSSPDEGEDHRKPVFSPDGEGLMYLSANSEGVQSLHYLNGLDGDDPVQVTASDMHVSEAVFSPDGETIYYIAMTAEDLKARPGQQEGGLVLYRTSLDGEGHEGLTDDRTDLSGLNISEDGETLYYMGFYTDEMMLSYDIESGEESEFLTSELPQYLSCPQISPDGAHLSYVVQDGETESGTFLYELFRMDVEDGEETQLTDYDSSVGSPAFFHQEERIAFLAQENWPSAPENYQISTVSYDGGDMTPLELDLPEAENTFQPGAVIDRLVNAATMTILYLLMFGLMTAYLHSVASRTYLPVIASGILTGIALVSSFLVTANYPWGGFAMILLTIWLAGCTVVLLIFAFIYKKIAGRSSEE